MSFFYASTRRTSLTFQHLFFYFPNKENSCVYKIRCRRGNKHFDMRFWWIRSVCFPWEDRKGASYDIGKGWKGVHFPPELAFQPLILYFLSVSFPICNLTWRGNNYVYRQGRGINRRIESTKQTIVIDNTEIILSHSLFSLRQLFNC